MIEPVYEAGGKRGTSRPKTEYDRLFEQVDHGCVSVGPEAARKIALIVESRGGFWDHPEKAGQP